VRLAKLSAVWRDSAAQAFALTAAPQRHFGEFEYAAKTWSRERRVIVKAEHNEARRQSALCRHQHQHRSAGSIRTRLFGARGDMEIASRNANWACSPIAQAASFGGPINSACCSPHWHMSSWSACARSAWQAPNWRARRSRLCAAGLLKVGAVIVRNTRRVRFFLSSAFPHQESIHTAAHRFVSG